MADSSSTGFSSYVGASIAVKKLLNKATTSAKKTVAGEPVATLLQFQGNTIFADTVPNFPALTLGVNFCGNTTGSVELVRFQLEVDTAGSTYVTSNNSGDGGGDDDLGSLPGDTSTSTAHAWFLKLPAQYSTYGGHPSKGSDVYVDNGYLKNTNGKLQIVPAAFSTDSSDPYRPRLYNAAGSEISAANDIDWYVDTFSGVLFIQDPTPNVAANVPSYIEAYLYIGEFVSDQLGVSSTTSLSSSISVASNDASYYITFVSSSTPGPHALKIDANLSYNPSTNILSTTASWAQNASTASNISNAFVGSVAPNNQILISKGTGQVTGSGLLSFDPTVDGGQLTIGAVTIDQNSFNSTNDTFDFGFGTGPGSTSYIQITNANNPNLATITFNMTASFTGPTTTVQSINSTFDDQFILLASASSQTGGGTKDSGIVFEYGNTIGTGSALFFDASDSKRLAFRYSASIDNTNMAPQAYVNMTFVAGIDGSITSTSTVDSLFDNVGGDSTAVHTSKGFMFIDVDGNIYIKS